MANHTIVVTAVEEPLYQKYLSLIGKTDVEIMAGLKQQLVSQVVQTINELGRTKFDALPVAEKISFLT